MKPISTENLEILKTAWLDSFYTIIGQSITLTYYNEEDNMDSIPLIATILHLEVSHGPSG
jgi:hypothetical protein